MTSTRAHLQEILDTLTDDQVETVLSFAAALANGRAVVASCDVEETTATGPDQEPAGGV